MRVWLLIILGSLSVVSSQGQSSAYSKGDYRPTTPSAHSILKYIDNSVDLYHGIPQISIPIAELKLEGMSFPFSLSYHAGGVRVTEEASWIGLGWDMQVPTIVQTVNDEDDLNMRDNGRQVTAYRKPDWPANSGSIYFPKRYATLGFYVTGQGWVNPYPAYPAEKRHAYRICYDYYVPVGGDFDTRQVPMLENVVDSEPDIFKVSLFGQALTFSRNPTTGFTILNGTSHRVRLTPGTTPGYSWDVLDGEGYVYQFTQRQAQVPAFEDRPCTVIWYLTSITGPHGRQLTVTYSRQSTRYSIDYRERYQQVERDASGASYVSSCEGCYGSNPAGSTCPSCQYGVYPSASAVSEFKMYPQFISSDDQILQLFSSSRLDVRNAEKLDSIQVYTYAYHAGTPTLRRRLRLQHDYFVAAPSPSATLPTTFDTKVRYRGGSVGGDRFQSDSLRLRLSSLYESTSGTYRFTYDSQPLPRRNSFAQDYWGYANGAVANQCIVPNPNALGVGNIISVNQHPILNTQLAAVLQYARAGMLTRMSLPTGGSKSFEYELNTFRQPEPNRQLPDIDSTDNKLTKGNGLRIKRIISRPTVGSPALISEYRYKWGLPQVPLTYYRHYRYRTGAYSGMYNGGTIESYTFIFDELNGSSRYNPSLLGSGTGVGYGQVTEQRTDSLSGEAAGRTDYYYTNRWDNNFATDNSGLYYTLDAVSDLSLPAYQNPTRPENGLLDSVRVYDSQQRLLRKTVTQYRTDCSLLDYGVKIFSAGSWMEIVAGLGNGNSQLASTAMHYLGYYPLFQKTSYKLADITTSYGTDGISFRQQVAYAMDGYNRTISRTEKQVRLAPSGLPLWYGPTTTQNYQYPDMRHSAPKGDFLLLQANRLEEPVQVQEVHSLNPSPAATNSLTSYQYDKWYAAHPSGAVLAQVVETKAYPSSPQPQRRRTLLSAYDGLGRCRQTVQGAGAPTTRLWHPWLSLLLAEATNASVGEIAYSSFEVDSVGGWSSATLLANNAVTGRYCAKLTQPLTTPPLTSAKKYTLTYWAKDGTPQVVTADGTATLGPPQVVVSRSDGWVQYRVPVTVSAAPARLRFNGSSTTLLDEVRLCPTGAQLQSYTYDVWQHVLSQTDPSGRVSTYEYDAAGRLVRTRDEQGRILAQQQYHYAQP